MVMVPDLVRRKMGELTDEELRHVVTRDAGDYSDEALSIAREVIAQRGLSLTPTSPPPPTFPLKPSRFATASLACGVAGVGAWLVSEPIFGLVVPGAVAGVPLGMAALLLARAARKEMNNPQVGGKDIAKAGAVLGLLLIVPVAFVLVSIFLKLSRAPLSPP